MRPPALSPPEAMTRAVLALVERRFAHHPGTLTDFAWPVTPEDARATLEDFVEHRLVSFVQFQDADDGSPKA